MENTQNQLSAVLLSLFKGVLYRDQNEKLWNELLNLHNAVVDYVAVLHLELVLDEAEGYAFLKSKPDNEEENYPKLIARRALTFEVTLLLALLRKSLLEFDSSNAEVRLILSQTQLMDLLKPHFGDSSNQAKIADKIETTINKVVELGFLHKLKIQQNEPHFEVKRILKAFIDVAWLQQFDQWLAKAQGKTEENDE